MSSHGSVRPVLGSLRTLVVVCGLVILIALSGCDGGGDGGGGDGNGGGSVPASSQTSDVTLDVIDQVLRILVGDTGQTQAESRAASSADGVVRSVTTRQEPVNITLECLEGDVSFDGEADRSGDDFTVDGVIAFHNCEGINGSLTIDSEGSIAGDEITIRPTMDGRVRTEGCTIDFLSLAVDAAATTRGSVIPPIIGNGTIEATCNGESIACTLRDINLLDRDVFANSCMGM
jgi:hypothetical protein